MAAFIRHAEENKVIKSERVFPFLRDTGAITGQRNLRGALCAHNGEEKGNSGGKKKSRREEATEEEAGAAVLSATGTQCKLAASK